MLRNVEIKARLADPESFRRRVGELATEGPRSLAQHDTFFRCRSGRLKLRRFGDGSGELIAYSRADERGPRTSSYHLVPCADPGALESALAESVGVLGEVRKQRTVWLVGRTRVHLDAVDDLGWFVELEVVLAEGDSVEDGEREARELARRLAIDPGDLVPRAYLDLLLEEDRGDAASILRGE